MNGWEYTTRLFDFRGETLLGGKYGDGSFDVTVFDRVANSLGWEGWELVNVFDTNYGTGNTKYVLATFKRPLTDERRGEVQHMARP